MSNILFVLGGNDAEMLLVKALLSQAGQKFLQPNAGWGELKYSPSDLGLKVVPAEHRTDRPGMPAHIEDHHEVVFVEATPTGEWPTGTKVVVIDHHNERSGDSASVLQVLRHLEAAVDFRISAATRRWAELIAANDAAYIPGMLAFGATSQEIERIRAFDRKAQGVTSYNEADAERALAERPERYGRMRVVRINHSRTAAVADRLFETGDDQSLLIITEADEGELNFFGRGTLCAELKEKFGGWAGGSGLGKHEGQAFWGRTGGNLKEVVEFLKGGFVAPDKL